MLLLGVLSWLLVAGCFLQPAVVPTQHAALLLLARFEPAMLLTALVPIAVSVIHMLLQSLCGKQLAARFLMSMCMRPEGKSKPPRRNSESLRA